MSTLLEIEMTEIDRLIEANKLARALASGDVSFHDGRTRRKVLGAPGG